MTTIQIGPIDHDVDAPLPLVYQMLCAVGQGGGEDGERAEILERDGDTFVADFWTRVTLPGGVDRLVRTRERVRLRPPDSIDFEHLDGPVRGLQETISVAANAAGGTRMTYVGRYEPRGLVGRIGARFVARPAIARIMREHFEDLAGRAEARAARSRVFAPGDRAGDAVTPAG